VATTTSSVPSSSRRAEFLVYLGTFLLALGILFWVLRLWRADLRVPFAYEEDCLPILTWTKTMLDHGWWLTNPNLGAPGRLEMYDYPTNCNLHFLVLKALCLFTTDPAVASAANLYLSCAGPMFPFFGLGLCLYFASQGAGKVLGPVLASSLRLGVVAVGTLLLAWQGAPLWSLFALVGLSLAAYGGATAAAVYITDWGQRAPPPI